MSKLETKEYTAQFYDEYTGMIDYYSGHGHSFSPKNLIGCLVLSVPITYTETQQELKELLIQEANGLEVDWVSDKAIDIDKANKSIDKLLETFGTENPNAQWDSEPISEDYDYDLPIYLVVIHIYE